MRQPNYTFPQFFGDFWRFLDGKRSWFVFLAVLSVIGSSLNFFITYLIGKTIDFFTKYSPGSSLTVFYWYVGTIAALGILYTVLRAYSKLRIGALGAEIRKDVRLASLSKLIALELRWHEKQESGAKMQKIVSGSDSISRSAAFFVNFGVEIITAVGGTFIAFLLLDFKYAIFAAFYCALYLVISYYYDKKQSEWEDKLNSLKEKIGGKFHEAASNLMTVKSLGIKKNVEDSMKKLETQYYHVWLTNKRYARQKSKILGILAYLGYAFFILMVGFDVVGGTLTLGFFAIFSSYFWRLRSGLDLYSNSMSDLIEIKSGVGRIVAILKTETPDREAESLLEADGVWKKIEFRNVSFTYKDKPVLKNFSLVIKRGEKIGVVGRSGVGKSTLIKLLLGLYQPEKGVILVDGVPLNSYKQSSLTRIMGVVLQESEMFNAPLIENICTFDGKKEMSRLGQSIRVAHLEMLINKLPRGVNTIIGERGYKVSGGERQRIGIARAVYRSPSLLILDEATSHLDSTTERVIQQALNKELQKTTMLVIAHRLSTLKDVDRIIVLNRGTIAEEGDFDSLVKKKGIFYELYQTQKQFH